jgi:hypothetical protein
MKLTTIILPAALVLAGLPGLRAGDEDDAQGGRPLATALIGAEEVPGPGDSDGSGEASITLNHGQGQICWTLSVEGIATATAAHIHRGASGVAGPVVVPLTAPAEGTSEGCVDADRDLIKAILQDPDQFYVNVHNAEFPQGAIRGQLGR